MSANGKKSTTLDKSKFPYLLNKVITNIDTRSGENLKSGFAAVGIYPFDRQKVLCKFPCDNVEGVNNSVSQVFLSHLQQIRYSEESPKQQRKKS